MTSEAGPHNFKSMGPHSSCQMRLGSLVHTVGTTGKLCFAVEDKLILDIHDDDPESGSREEIMLLNSIVKGKDKCKEHPEILPCQMAKINTCGVQGLSFSDVETHWHGTVSGR